MQTLPFTSPLTISPQAAPVPASRGRVHLVTKNLDHHLYRHSLPSAQLLPVTASVNKIT